MIRWLFHVLGVDDAPDPAWRPTGYRYRYTGHDESKARAYWEQQELEIQRKLAARRAGAGPTEDGGPR